MIDHVGLTVSNFEKSKEFYKLALAPIGFQLLAEVPASVSGSKDFAGFGEPPKPEFWIGSGTPNNSTIHVAFQASSRAQVDSFFIQLHFLRAVVIMALLTFAPITIPTITGHLS